MKSDLLKSLRKFKHYLICYSTAAVLYADFVLARDLLKAVADIDYPMDSNTSITVSQPNFALNDIEVIQIPDLLYF